MTRRVGLAHLTVLSVAPPEMIRLAARTGYDAVGLRLIAVTPDSPGYPLMQDAAMLRETRASLAETGLAVHDIEFVKITPELEIGTLEPFIAAGAELGARQIITAPYDPDLARLAARLGAIADLAGAYGLGVVLEFFPWTVVPDLATAGRVVAQAQRVNAGLLVDTLHFSRAGSAHDELCAIPREQLPFVHVCDAAPLREPTTEALLHTARAERLPPGEGGLDIAGILARMPPDIPISLEVPMAALTQEIGAEGVARRVRTGLTRLTGI